MDRTEEDDGERLVSFPPIVGEKPHTLILGSMPGAESLRRSQYYAFPGNHFWKILALLFDEATPEEYSEKMAMLKRNGIALWDILLSCERKGSLDSNIKSGKANAIPQLLKDYPTIERIGFNGQTSHRFFARFIGMELLEERGIAWHTLPSSSPAYTIPIAEKISAWQILFTI